MYMSNKEIWRDITDPRRAEYVDDLEAGLKEPEFENLQIPEHLGPVQEKIDDHKIKRYALRSTSTIPGSWKKAPFMTVRVSAAPACWSTIWCRCSPPCTAPAM